MIKVGRGTVKVNLANGQREDDHYPLESKTAQEFRSYDPFPGSCVPQQ